MRYLVLVMLLSLPSWAAAQVSISSQGDIVADVCVYGRGENAMTAALAEGSVKILEFIRGSQLYSDNMSSDELASQQDTIEWLSRMRAMQQEGLFTQSLPVTYSRPRLQGSDTCLEITLARSAHMPSSAGEADVQWSEAEQTATVVVTGEGWADRQNNLSAQSAAEMDALKRAVSQVVGVWVNQQRSQFSSAEFGLIDGQDTERLQEVISQQLHTRSSGMVKEWTLLSKKSLPNHGVEVSIQAVVERQQLIGVTRDILAAIGSPRVQVKAPDSIKNTLMDWLSSQGIEVDNQANLVLEAQARLLTRGKNSRLALTTQVKDRSGNQYSYWENDSSLVALPTGPNTEQNLVDVHLAVPEQAQALKDSLQTGFTSLVSQGGLVHKVIISQRYLAQPEKVQALMATIGGVSNVVTNSTGRTVTVSLRYPDSSGNLAAAVEQSLQPILSTPLPSVQVRNEYEIIYQ